jgi:hypothetical protein
MLGLVSLGCGAGSGPEASTIPAPSSPKVAYFGTSPSDVWAFFAGSANAGFQLQHWGGSAWKDVATAAGIQRASTACVAGPGKAWVAGDIVLGILDADGTLNDFSAQAPVEPPSAFRSVQCGHGNALLNAGRNGGGADDMAKLFLWDGNQFKQIETPPGTIGGRVGAATLFAADDIYLPAAVPLMQVASARDTAGPDYHWDGQSWLRGNANDSKVGVAGASSNFPPDDVWLSCGHDAAHFDGAVLWPLPAPAAATTSCRFGYRSGKPFMVFAAEASPGDVPEAYACDTQSNCTLLDVAGSGNQDYRRVEWDGKSWTDNRKVATVKTCVGPGCGYNGGGASSSFAGELESGHLLLAATDGSDNRVYLAE